MKNKAASIFLALVLAGCVAVPTTGRGSQNANTKEGIGKAEIKVNLDDGGNTAVKQSTESPLPATNLVSEQEKAIEQPKQQKKTVDPVLAEFKSDNNKPQSDNHEINPEILKQQAPENSAVAAQIRRDYNALQPTPRKTFIGVHAKQISVALWANYWARKIEHIGTGTYPVDARGNKLRGLLRVSVEINADGSILSAVIDRSSGNKELDDAALRILRLAAPFPRLPQDMLDDSGKPATVLVITRSWNFGRDDSLGSD